MKVSRRNFLLGAASVTALVVAAPVLKLLPPTLPILYGDGETDDTLAMRALFNGGPVLRNGEVIQASRKIVYIPEVAYKITNTIEWDAFG